MSISTLVKRDFSKRPFKLEKITSAILKAMQSVNNGDEESANLISEKVYRSLLNRQDSIQNYVPSVEEIQDVVEQQLMKSEYLDVAKSYILYRNLQAEKRKRNIFEKRIN